MKDPSKVLGPVIIGGVGGSGTRVVAEILKLFGFYLGHDLNNASDNLSYTLLFKRPAWFKKHYPKSRQFTIGLRILEKVLYTGKSLTYRERRFLERAVLEMKINGHNHMGHGRGKWAYQRFDHINNKPAFDESQYTGWGWKEPNSHLALPAFMRYFPNFRYIHTIRHGLDMAFSDNQQQLYNWADLFNVDFDGNPDSIPSASFRYWVEANRRALEAGKKMGKDNFLLVNFDALCTDPRQKVQEIAQFLRVDISEEQLLTATRLPVRPESIGRYKQYTEMKYDQADLEFLKGLGFDYED